MYPRHRKVGHGPTLILWSEMTKTELVHHYPVNAKDEWKALGFSP